MRYTGPALQGCPETGKRLTAAILCATALRVSVSCWYGWAGTGVIAGLLSQLIPKTENAFLAILISIGFVLLFLIFSILMFVAAAFVAKPLWSKSEPAVFHYCREDAASGCLHLRRYYRLEKPYLLTKCYDSSIKGFVDHDICLFFVEGDLRLTVDLVNGFTHGWKDLGCYTLQLDELSLSNVKIGSREALELKAGKIWFLLGKRAGGSFKGLSDKRSGRQDYLKR